jgi:hypothetical protein
MGFRHLLVADTLHNVPDLVLREGIANSDHFLIQRALILYDARHKPAYVALVCEDALGHAAGVDDVCVWEDDGVVHFPAMGKVSGCDRDS